MKAATQTHPEAPADLSDAEQTVLQKIRELITSPVINDWHEGGKGQASIHARTLLDIAISVMDRMVAPSDAPIDTNFYELAALLQGALLSHREDCPGEGEEFEQSLYAAYRCADVAAISHGFYEEACVQLAAGISIADAGAQVATTKRHTRAQLTLVLETIAGQMNTLNNLLIQIQCADDGFPTSLAIDAAQLIATSVGALADEAAGAGIIGNADRWHYGPSFADAGKEASHG